jgi:acetyl-CoA carboxylase biotin carboxyl carrier protein
MAEKNQMDLQKVKELIDLMVANDLVEVEIADGHNKILLKRPQPDKHIVTHLPAVEPAATQEKTEAQAKQQQEEDETLVEIASPIVGTFYASPGPDSEHFVTVGSQVGPDTVVCIVEAMKVMNEIKAETSGTIVKILCKAGQAVEYGQVLFKVKPD